MTISIELELKIDEVIKRLVKNYDYNQAYTKFVRENSEEVNNPKRELIYILFDYNHYQYYLCFESKIKCYLLQSIILGAF